MARFTSLTLQARACSRLTSFPSHLLWLLIGLLCTAPLLTAQSWKEVASIEAMSRVPTRVIVAHLSNAQFGDVVTTSAGELSVYQNDGKGHLKPAGTAISASPKDVAGIASSSIAGLDDLLVWGTVSGERGLYLLRNGGGLTFSAPVRVPLPASFAANGACHLYAGPIGSESAPGAALGCGQQLLILSTRSDGALSFAAALTVAPIGTMIASVSDDVGSGDLLVGTVNNTGFRSGTRVVKSTYGFTVTRAPQLWGYLTDVDGDLSTDFLTHDSQSVSFVRPVFGSEVALAYTAPSGCSVEDVDAGTLIPVKWSRGLDLIVALQCAGNTRLAVLQSTAQVQLALQVSSVSLKDNGIVLNIHAAGHSRNSVPSGQAIVFLNGAKTGVLQLDSSGSASITLRPQPSMNRVQIAYPGDRNHAAVAEVLGVFPRKKPARYNPLSQRSAKIVPAVLAGNSDARFLRVQGQYVPPVTLSSSPATSCSVATGTCTGTDYPVSTPLLNHAYYAEVISNGYDTQFSYVEGDGATGTLDGGTSPPSNGTLTVNGSLKQSNVGWNVYSETWYQELDPSCQCTDYYVYDLYSADVPITFPSAGTYTVDLAYEAPYAQTSVGAFTFAAKASPSLSVSSPSAIFPGRSMISASLSAASSPAGSVTFALNGQTFGSTPISGGVATIVAPFLGASTYTVSATYSGDTNNNSAGGSAQYTVAKASPYLTVSAPTAIFPAQLNITATISDGSYASGTVTFTWNYSHTWGSARLVNGVASIPAPFLGASVNYPIEVSYSGDVNDNAASGSGSYAISKGAPIVEIAASPAHSTTGQTVTLTSLLDSTAAGITGITTFYADGASIGTGNVSTLNVTNLVSYSQTFSHWTISPSATVQDNAASAPDGTRTASVLTANAGSSDGYVSTGSGGLTSVTVGAPYSVSVWIRAPGGSPSSTDLVISDGGTNTNIATCPISAQWSRCSATYVPTTPSVAFQIGGGNAITNGAQVDIWGAQFAAGASLQSYIPTYSSQASGFGGIATLSYSSFAIGTHTITADYSGDVNYTPANSGSTIETAAAAKANSTLGLSASATSISYGSAATFTGTVVPSSASGTVVFFNGGSPLGSSALASGTSLLTAANLLPGTHIISASYGGDSSDTPATSLPLTITVAKAPVTLSVSSSANPSTYKQSVTFTIAAQGVAGSPVPTGTVTITDGAVLLGTAPLLSGSATILAPTLAVRSHSLTVTYNGDTYYR